ncbi:MAG: hypothetical protein ACOYL9_01715, partial [Ilumatobacteraceae bacterium]
RRALGWRLIIGAAVLAVLVAATLGYRAVSRFMSYERTRMPGSLTVDCTTGDKWRIGPATGTSQQFGPVTVSESNEVVLGPVAVQVDGEDVPVSGMGNTSETFSIFSTTFTAVATFTCPRSGTAIVEFSGPPDVEVVVFPSLGATFVALILTGLGGLAVLGLAVPGIVLAVRHRRRADAKL